MSVATPLYPNLQSSLNQKQVPSPSVTSAEVRLSQSEEFASDQNEFVFITDYNQVIVDLLFLYYSVASRNLLG